MGNGPPKIELDPYGLGTILKHYFVAVPLNQRDYAWEDENVKQLYDDFAGAISADEEHFVGSIVTIPKGKNALEVVDGQQRLATTALLLAAIREHLQAIDEPELVQSVSTYLADIDRKAKAEVPKLKLNVDDNDLFAQLITKGTVTGPGKRDSHKKLIKAYQQAKQRVKDVIKPYSASDQGDVLGRWIDFIEHETIAVLLRVPDDTNAFKMFETLNDRGLRVSQADLVKNHLYETAKGRRDEAQHRWTQMRSILESLEDEDFSLMLFLRHAMIVMEGHMREVDVFERVQERAKSPQLVVTLASQLEEMAGTYVATFNPEHEIWSGYPASARRAVEVLNLLKIKPMRPLIVGISRRMAPKQAAAALQFLVVLGVRLIIASTTRSGSVEIPLSAAAKSVNDGTIKTDAELRTALAQITPRDAQFETAFRTALVSNPKFARYYLRSLEQRHNKTQEPWFIPESDPEKITLEHVLPRVPEGNWPSFDDDTAASYVNRLGNQVLLPRQANSNLKSSGFAEKRPVLQAAPYALTKQVSDVPEWTPKTIETRQALLAKLAVQTWPIK